MIDYAFIAELEGFSCEGYVPDAEYSQSGVTIASGFDLGQRSKAELQAAFSAELATKLLPYTGKKGETAQLALGLQPLVLSQMEVETINCFAHQQAEQRLRHYWDNANAFCEFDELPAICQTVIASVAFQYGHLPTRTPMFWWQVIHGDWQTALNNLRDFGDRYATRRNKEADLLETHLLTDTH